MIRHGEAGPIYQRPRVETNAKKTVRLKSTQRKRVNLLSLFHSVLAKGELKLMKR
jgi:hypothetical protein